MKIADHRRQPTAAVSRPRLTRIAAVMATALLATPWSPVQAGATLYSFGAAAGDTALARCDNCFIQTSWAGLGPAGSSLSLPFFRSSYTSSFVNNNGGLSFNSGWSGWDVGDFPTGSLRPVVAPFWADVDTRNALSGQVWYRTSQDASLLTTLAQNVKSAYGGGYLSFNPTFAQIVTWDRVGYYLSAADKLNSFQLALVSDGSHTYTLFKYPTGGIGDPIKNWDRGQHSPNSFASVGFDGGDGVNFYNTPGSRTPSVRNLPNLSNTVPANPGTFVYRLDQSAVPASPGRFDLTYGLASHTWAPAAGSASWGVNGTNWTALNVNGTPVTRDSPTQWRNGDSAVFGASAGTVSLNGTLVAQRVTVNTSGTTFSAIGTGTSLQLDSLDVPTADTVVNFAGNLVVITHAGDAGVKRVSAGAPLLQQGALAQGKLVFTDTSVLVARDADMVNGAEIVLNNSAQLQLYTAGATTRASVLSFDNTGGGTSSGSLDLRGLSTMLGAVRSQGPSAGAGRITNSVGTAATLTVLFETSSQTFSGLAQNGIGTLALSKAGSGSWTLSGANTDTGGTTLAGGALVLGSAGAIGTAGSISFTGGTLQHSAANTTDYSARFSTADNQRYSIDTGGQSVTLATALTSIGGTLDKRGTGTLQLSKAGTYTGATSVTGGTLVLLGSTQSLSFSVASGAALDLRSASISFTGSLVQGGSLLLGANNLTITQDYSNLVGTGNAFNRRAGVTGTGQILAAGTTKQVLAGTAVTGGTTATPTLALGNARVGSSVTRSIEIQNAGSGGPSLRGALQTTGITSAALSGSGVTAQNWGAVSQGATGPVFDVVYSPTQAGVLQGQALAVVNNFDNVAGQTLAITGTAYRPASASAMAPVQVPAQRVGGTLLWPLGLSNTAVADGFSERLNASIAGTGAITLSGSVSQLGAGASSSMLLVGVNTATAGAKSGTATVTLASDGTGTTGLAALALGTQQVSVSGKVYAPAVAQAQTTLVDFGIVRVGDTVATRPVVVGNAATGALTDTLRATLGDAPAPFTAAGTASAVAAGQVDGGSLSVGLMSTASAGVFNGAAQIGFASQNPEMAELALAGAAVVLQAQVNNLAAARLSLVAGAGSFSGSAGRYTLSFGTLVQGSAALTAQLALGNAASQVGWSDALAGSFDLSALPPGQMLAAAGFGSFSGVAAGTAFDTLVLRLDSAALGDFTGLILLNARSTNAYDPAGRALGPIELHLQGSVVAVPEPQTWLLMLVGLGLLLPKLLRRRSVVRRDSSRA